MNRGMKWCWLVLLAGLASCAYAGDKTIGYQLLQQVKLPDDGGWDYLLVDSAARRVYITHETEVLVVDADTYQVIGKVEGIQGAHGVALAPELGKGYVSSGKSGSVVVFDLKTLKKIAEVSARKGSDAIVYEPVTGRVFAFNGSSGNCTAIDAASDKEVATFDLGGKPEFAAVDGKGYVYDNLEDKNALVKIDAKTLEIIHCWPVAPGDSPSGLAMDTKSNRLFIGCHNKKVVVMGAVKGTVIQTLPIGQGIDATYFDPASGTVFNSCGEGVLSVAHQKSADRYKVVENAKTQPGARTMAFDAKTGHVFLVTAQFEAAPAPTKENPKPRRKMVPGTFELLVLGR
jgi:DNA-binding beta-propeller fold protein YncE